MITIEPCRSGVEINTMTCGISGRIWLDLTEAVTVQDWFNANLSELRRQDALRQARDRDEKIKNLKAELALLQEEG